MREVNSELSIESTQLGEVRLQGSQNKNLRPVAHFFFLVSIWSVDGKYFSTNQIIVNIHVEVKEIFRDQMVPLHWLAVEVGGGYD